MGLFGARSSAKLRSNDPQVRLAALNDLDDGKQDRLAELALGDGDARVRLAAAHRVTDNRRLQDLLRSSDAEVQRVAKERLSGVAAKLAMGQTLDRCREILGTINEQKSLAELTLSASDPAVREAALARLLAQPEPSPALLVMIAVQDASGTLARRAVERLDRKGLLKDVARKAKNEEVRKQAEARSASLTDTQNKPSAEKLRRARQGVLDALVPTALKLALTADWVRAAAEWRELEAKRDAALEQNADASIDEPAQAALDRIARARGEFDAKVSAEQERLAAATAARERFLAELETREPVGGDADTTSERATLTTTWNGLGEIGALLRRDLDARFRAACMRLFPALPAPAVSEAAAPAPAADPAERLSDADRAELEQLSAESEQLTTASNWRDAQDRFRILHKRWNQLSAPLPNQHPLRARFLDAYATFKDRHQAWKSGKRDEAVVRVAELEKLAKEAEVLAASEPKNDAEGRAHYDRLRDLQVQWKQVGPVRPDILAPLRGRFRAAIDIAYGPVRKLREAEDWERFQHLAQAEELIAEVEALAVVEDFAVIARSVKQVQARWKNVGPLPGERREAIWQKFRAACDVQFARCQPYFAELDTQRQGNLDRKYALIAEVDQILAATEATVGLAGSPADLAAKRPAAERMKAIQQEWKAIGPVPRDVDQEVWKRFREGCDRFFTRHKGDIDARRQEEQQNLSLKLALCVATEDLAKEIEEAIAAGDGKHLKPPTERLREVKEIQASWKNLGHVPREQVEAVWTRFRTACDRVYATCKEHLDAQEAERQDNLKKKQALLDEAEELLKHENARWFKDDLMGLQRQWRDIGYVPREAMDTLGARYKDVFDRVHALLRETAT